MQDFISFACDQFKISKKELLSPLRAVRVMYPRAVIGLIIGSPQYMGLGCSAMGRQLQRNYSVYFRYLKTINRYKDVCDEKRKGIRNKKMVLLGINWCCINNNI